MPADLIRMLKSSNGNIKIKRIPKLDNAMTLSHKKIIENMRLCPYSEFFGETRKNLKTMFPSKSIAVHELTKMIMRWQKFRALSQISERQQEFSSSNNSSRGAQFSANQFPSFKKSGDQGQLLKYPSGGKPAPAGGSQSFGKVDYSPMNKNMNKLV